MRLGPGKLAGSSPRVRGKRQRPVHLRGRLIPARAGKTRRIPWPSRQCGAHPRACGENIRRLRGGPGERGSSPRVRGKLVLAHRVRRARGLIPARAGKTVGWRGAHWTPTAHPRACGENTGFGLRTIRSLGSSPRVRGKRQGGRGRGARRGLIPARAGKTLDRSSAWRRMGAHPRACGENARERSAARREKGSSPRVRGKRLRPPVGEVLARLIPARAGKTSSAAFPLSGGAAHPRACGENWPASGMTASGAGSSPRVRGKRVLEGDEGRKVGLIPARAGKTGVGRVVLARVEAHPRACGENSHSGYTFGTGGGSSPRVRGKPLSHARRGQVLGLIPARAGKTRTPI